MTSEVKVEPKVGDLVVLPAGARVVGIIVGLENYRPAEGKQIEPVPFAKADVEAFKATLEEAFSAHRPELFMLTDADATLATLVNETKARIWGLGENDLFIFYYAGHGFHDETGNRLTVWDTDLINIDGTTMSVEGDLLAPLRDSPCQRVLVFVDACASRFKPLGRKIVTPLDTEALSHLLQAATFSAVFLSCRAGEQSFPDSELKHGVWTYYLLKALGGRAREAIGAGGYITGATLQDYLGQEVPRHVSRHPGIRGIQTPQSHVSASGTFAIRHVSEVVDASVAIVEPGAAQERSSNRSSDLYPGSSTSLFHDRFASAFPGVRAPRWYTEPADIQRRLTRLLAKPLRFANGAPFWWWGDGNMHIERFDYVEGRLYLMNAQELEIVKIAAAPGRSYWGDFVYVEVAPMAPTGANEYATPEDIARQVAVRGYAEEQYGLFDGRTPISRGEYDDGAAEIDGDLVDTIGQTELRVRYLTRYNFLLAAQGSPINNLEFDRDLSALLRVVLADGAAFVELVEAVHRLPRRQSEL